MPPPHIGPLPPVWAIWGMLVLVLVASIVAIVIGIWVLNKEDPDA
jgi:hypothetical protein